MELIAKTLQGLEPVLADEIEQLQGRNIRLLNRAVQFQGDRELMYRANWHLLY
jgi:putative N6-adenine-specific DNA methylase